MQTILIPTNFKDTAFNCIPALCEQFNGQQLNIVFTHFFNLSDSISDLLMLSRRNREFEYINDEFYEHCAQSRRRFSQIGNISINFFYGGTVAAFKAFIEANQVNYILDPSNCTYSKLNKKSIETETLVEKAAIPVIKLNRENSFTVRAAEAPAAVEVLEEV